MATAVAELAIKMTVEDDSQAGFSSVSRSVQRLKSSASSQLSSIGQAATRVGATLREGISNGATFALGAIGAMARGMGTAIRGVINTVFSLKTALIGLATGAALKMGWDWLIDPNIQLENMRMTIETLVGDAEAAGKAIDFIMKEALRPGFKPQEVYAAGQMLVPFAKDAEGRFNQEMFEQMMKTAQVLKASTPGKTLEDAAYALREAMSGDWISLQDRFNIPRSTINKLKEAYGVAQGGSKATAESVEDLRLKQRDLLWEIEELSLAMQEGERVQLGRVTSVTKQAAADLKQQHRMVQLREQLEKVNGELAAEEAAFADTGDSASEMETNLSIVNDALDEMGYGFDLVDKQAATTSGTIDTLKGRFGELMRIMGEEAKIKISESLNALSVWVAEHWDELESFARLVGEKIATGIETMATWIATIDWEGVGSSLKSWGEGFAGVATFLGEVLRIINTWPSWAKSLLIGGALAQVTTGLPGNILKAAAFTAKTMYVTSAVTNVGGAGAGGAGGVGKVGTAAAGAGLGPVALMVAGAAAMAALAYAGVQNWQTQWAGLSPEERLAKSEEQARRGLGGGRWRTEGLKDWQRQPENVNITVEPANNTFQFDGTLSSTEEARLMGEWADAFDKSYDNLARKVGARYKR